MPRNYFEEACQCCGQKESDINDRAREMGVAIHRITVESFPGPNFLGKLTLCSWCRNALAEESRDPLKKLLGEKHDKIEEAMALLQEARNA